MTELEILQIRLANAEKRANSQMKVVLAALEKLIEPDCVRVMTSQGSPNYDGQKWIHYGHWEELKTKVKAVHKLAKAFVENDK